MPRKASTSMAASREARGCGDLEYPSAGGRDRIQSCQPLLLSETENIMLYWELLDDVLATSPATFWRLPAGFPTPVR